MLTNRQPTLHKPGMMAHRARVLKVCTLPSCAVLCRAAPVLGAGLHDSTSLFWLARPPIENGTQVPLEATGVWPV